MQLRSGSGEAEAGQGKRKRDGSDKLGNLVHQRAFLRSKAGGEKRDREKRGRSGTGPILGGEAGRVRY